MQNRTKVAVLVTGVAGTLVPFAAAATGDFAIPTITGFSPETIAAVLGAALVGALVIAYGWKAGIGISKKAFRWVFGAAR